MQSRHNFGAELDEGDDRGDESDDSSSFSLVGDIDAYWSVDDGKRTTLPKTLTAYTRIS